MSDREWPIIEDLPEEERQPFCDWLYGQTKPGNRDGTHGYYPHDYERWKATQRAELD